MKKTPNNDFVDHKLLIKKELQEASKVLNDFLSVEENLQKIQQGAKLMIDAINQGGKIISCGNGGSFCDAMHFAEELSGLLDHNNNDFLDTFRYLLDAEFPDIISRYKKYA